MTQDRQHARISYDEPVELAMNDQTHSARAINISQGGIFVETEMSPSFGDKLVLRIELPGVKKVSDIRCIVRWRKDDGLGLQFENLRAIEVWALNKLMHSLQDD